MSLSSGGRTLRNIISRITSYTAFRVPAMISGQPKELCDSIHPANVGGSAEARLRGTFVTLAAAARSAGDTTAITYELRTGASIVDNKLRATRHAIASGRFGIRAALTNSTCAGRWVNTIVRTSPMRFEIRTARNTENAEQTPVQNSSAPAAVTDRSKRLYSQSASSDWTVKPPAKASRLNTAASRYTTCFDSPSGCGRSCVGGSMAGESDRYVTNAMTPATA